MHTSKNNFDKIDGLRSIAKLNDYFEETTFLVYSFTNS